MQSLPTSASDTIAAVVRAGSLARPPLRPPRILFFGTPCQFSQIVFERLLAANITPIAIIIPAPYGRTDVSAPALPGQAQGPAPTPAPPAMDGRTGVSAPTPATVPAPAALAPIPLLQSQHDLVEFPLGHRVATLVIEPGWHPEVLGAIAALEADLACVACFPWRIPAALITGIPHGFLNIHPSLLPAQRGPDPVFWAFWHGQLATGVTLHAMDAGFDSGPIVQQQAHKLSEGIGYAAAERQLAMLGADLLVESIQSGAAFSGARRAQAQGGSYQSWPQKEHFRLSQSWPARRAYICLRGLANWGSPFQIALPGTTCMVAEAIGYDPVATLGQPFLQTEHIQIQMSPGVLSVRGRLLATPK